MENIVKLGYKELTFNTLYFVFVKEYNIFEAARLDKEKVRERIKQLLTYYYSIKQSYIISHKDYKENKQQYKVVEIPQKELKAILLKNKLCGYLTFATIVQEQEFDKTFDELYPKLINNIKSPCNIYLPDD